MKGRTPAEARRDFYQLLKRVNNNYKPIYIEGKHDEGNAIIIGMEDWHNIDETIYLEATGITNKVREHEHDNSGYANMDDTDWARPQWLNIKSILRIQRRQT